MPPGAGDSIKRTDDGFGLCVSALRSRSFPGGGHAKGSGRKTSTPQCVIGIHEMQMPRV